jgi:hypothetical protein
MAAVLSDIDGDCGKMAVKKSPGKSAENFLV